MTLSNSIKAFGLHQVTFIDRVTYDQFTAKILGDFDADFTEENVPLYGGSSSYPWDNATGKAKSTITLTFKQYDLNTLKYLSGYNASTANYTEDTDGDAAGAISSLTNLVGTSVSNSTTGVASGAPKSAQNPIFGDYYLKATGAATLDVYLNNDLGGLTYQNDALKITSSAITVPGTGGTVDIPNANITLTGGSGAIAFTTGDMAKFSAKPINTYNYEYKGGAAGASKPEFTLMIFTEKLSTNQYRFLELPRVKANGVSFKMKEKDWATFESEMMVLQDETKGYAWRWGIYNR